jgi:hypothetical protein
MKKLVFYVLIPLVGAAVIVFGIIHDHSVQRRLDSVAVKAKHLDRYCEHVESKLSAIYDWSASSVSDLNTLAVINWKFLTDGLFLINPCLSYDQSFDICPDHDMKCIHTQSGMALTLVSSNLHDDP